MVTLWLKVCLTLSRLWGVEPRKYLSILMRGGKV